METAPVPEEVGNSQLAKDKVEQRQLQPRIDRIHAIMPNTEDAGLEDEHSRRPEDLEVDVNLSQNIDRSRTTRHGFTAPKAGFLPQWPG